MAQYKYGELFKQSDLEIFDEIVKPGEEVPYSGIYRCEGCGREDAMNKGNPTATQNRHQHVLGQGDIRWRLIVRTYRIRFPR